MEKEEGPLEDTFGKFFSNIMGRPGMYFPNKRIEENLRKQEEEEKKKLEEDKDLYDFTN